MPQAAGGVCLKVTGKIPARRINTQIDGGEDLRARQLPEQVKKDKEENGAKRKTLWHQDGPRVVPED